MTRETVTQNIADTLYQSMLTADSLNRQLGDLVDTMADYDFELSGRICKIMALIQEVRASCGVEVEAVEQYLPKIYDPATHMDEVIKNFLQRPNALD